MGYLEWASTSSANYELEVIFLSVNIFVRIIIKIDA
jgi:hypothetical protein